MSSQIVAFPIIEKIARIMKKNRIYVFFVVTIILVFILIIESRGELKTLATSVVPNENKHILKLGEGNQEKSARSAEEGSTIDGAVPVGCDRP